MQWARIRKKASRRGVLSRRRVPGVDMGWPGSQENQEACTDRLSLAKVVAGAGRGPLFLGELPAQQAMAPTLQI